MLPLSDGVPTRRFPVANVALIVANFAVWIFYELPHLSFPAVWSRRVGIALGDRFEGDEKDGHAVVDYLAEATQGEGDHRCKITVITASAGSNPSRSQKREKVS